MKKRILALLLAAALIGANGECALAAGSQECIVADGGSDYGPADSTDEIIEAEDSLEALTGDLAEDSGEAEENLPSGDYQSFTLISDQGWVDPSQVYSLESDGTYANTMVPNTTEESYWHQFVNAYYYNSLTGEERALWYNLDNACMRLLTSKDSAEENYTPFVSCSSSLTRSQISAVSQMFVFSNPQYYFLQCSVHTRTSGNNKYVRLAVYSDFADGSTRCGTTEAFRNKINGILDYVNATASSNLEKEKVIYDYLCDHIVYESGTLDQSAYGGIVNGSCVCTGYAKSFALLMNATSADTIVVVSSSHAWNMVKGGDYWMNADPTYADQDTYINYSDFNVSNSEGNMQDGSHNVESWLSSYVPANGSSAGVQLSGNRAACPIITLSGNQVIIRSLLPGTIYYTTDGSTPTTSSKVYTGSLTAKANTTYKAITVNQWATRESRVSTYQYKVVENTPTTTIYRLYNSTNGEHLYTPDYNEVCVLTAGYGWTYEGVGWYAPTSGTAVYRLFNPGLNNHLYTTDLNEVNVLTSQAGWQLDNNGKPLFYSGGDCSVYRVYNEGLNGMHHLTTDYNEYLTLIDYGWSQESEKLQAVRLK